MADKAKMQKLIEDCQEDIAAYLPPESGIADYELLQRLIARLDGRQAKDALGMDWQGWWPKDDDHGDGGNDSPAPKTGAGAGVNSAPRLSPCQQQSCRWIGQVRRSSDRDVYILLGLSPCSIQGNRFERRL